MNGKDERFSLGLSKDKEPISKWIIPQSQISVIDVVSLNNELDTTAKPDTTECLDKKVNEVTVAKEEDALASTNTMKQDEPSSTLPKDESTDVTKHILSTEAVSTETINHENSTTETSGIGEKRKHEDIIPNTFKRAKTEQGCENGKTYYSGGGCHIN